MARNIELLQQTMQHIKDHPEQHRQEIWLNECGTAACFAGWAALLSGHTVRSLGAINAGDFHKLSTYLLGLNDAEAYKLFDAMNSGAMLELMVKDLVNGDELQDWDDYRKEAHDA